MLVFTYALDADTAQGIDMTAGRKSKYEGQTTLTKAREYYNDWARLDAEDGAVIPTIEGLALHLNVHRDTIHTWTKDPEKEEFSDIVKDIYAKQGRLLVNKSLTGDFREKTSNALLSRHHDYGERQHIDLTSSDDSFPTIIQLVAPEFDDDEEEQRH